MSRSEKLTILGSYNHDLTLVVEKFPKPQETVNGTIFYQNPGGKGANQAHAAAKAGAEVLLIAKIGQDTFGEIALQHFQEAHIDTSGILLSNQKPTGCAMIFVDKKTRENMIGISHGANWEISTDEIDNLKPKILESDLILLQFENQLEIIEYTMKLAYENHIPVLLNPAPQIVPFPKQLFPYIDLLIVNEIELNQMTAQVISTEDDIIKAGKEILHEGIPLVIITLGKRGVIAITKNNTIKQLAFPVTPVDTTGAGDAFIGNFATKYNETHDLEISLRFGAAAAALNITKSGATTGNPTRMEVENFLDRYKPN